MSRGRLRVAANLGESAAPVPLAQFTGVPAVLAASAPGVHIDGGALLLPAETFAVAESC
jgi:hypothetical protein